MLAMWGHVFNVRREGEGSLVASADSSCILAAGSKMYRSPTRRQGRGRLKIALNGKSGNAIIEKSKVGVTFSYC